MDAGSTNCDRKFFKSNGKRTGRHAIALLLWMGTLLLAASETSYQCSDYEAATSISFPEHPWWDPSNGTVIIADISCPFRILQDGLYYLQGNRPEINVTETSLIDASSMGWSLGPNASSFWSQESLSPTTLSYDIPHIPYAIHIYATDRNEFKYSSYPPNSVRPQLIPLPDGLASDSPWALSFAHQPIHPPPPSNTSTVEVAASLEVWIPSDILRLSMLVGPEFDHSLEVLLQNTQEIEMSLLLVGIHVATSIQIQNSSAALRLVDRTQQSRLDLSVDDEKALVSFDSEASDLVMTMLSASPTTQGTIVGRDVMANIGGKLQELAVTGPMVTIQASDAAICDKVTIASLSSTCETSDDPNLFRVEPIECLVNSALDYDWDQQSSVDVSFSDTCTYNRIGSGGNRPMGSQLLTILGLSVAIPLLL